MVNTASKKTHVPDEKARITLKQILFAITIAIIVVGSIYVLTSFAAKLLYEMPRAARVKEIYQSLNLSDAYVYKGGVIAGEQRVYNDDGTRSWSSYHEYIRGAPVTTTVDDVDQHIKAIGFSLQDIPYEDSIITERFYKNEKGEYIRLTAQSKPRLEYHTNATIMKLTPDQIAANEVDPNTGPTIVTIKVNLDNNNE